MELLLSVKDGQMSWVVVVRGLSLLQLPTAALEMMGTTWLVSSGSSASVTLRLTVTWFAVLLVLLLKVEAMLELFALGWPQSSELVLQTGGLRPDASAALTVRVQVRYVAASGARKRALLVRHPKAIANSSLAAILRDVGSNRTGWMHGSRGIRSSPPSRLERRTSSTGRAWR